MPTANDYLKQEIILDAYKRLRNAPRDTVNFGVRPNAEKCLAEYDLLQLALAGGDGNVIDISSMAEQFASVTAPVTPFITLLQCALRIVAQTPQVVDQAAAGQGMLVPPFGVDSEPLEIADYARMLTEAAAAIAAVGQMIGGDQ